MAEKSGLGYFMAFDGDTGGESGVYFRRRQAEAARQAPAAGRKTRSGPPNKGKATNRAVGPKQARTSAVKTEQENSTAPRDEIDESISQMPPAGSLARTKRLIMAALRVWELKQGIRE
jgi:hypothetical protein